MLLTKNEILALSTDEQKVIIDTKEYTTHYLDFFKTSAHVDPMIKSYYIHKRIISKFLEAGVTPDDVYKKMFE